MVEPMTFWARSSPTGFQPHSVEICIVCGSELEEDFALETARMVSATLLR